MTKDEIRVAIEHIITRQCSTDLDSQTDTLLDDMFNCYSNIQLEELLEHLKKEYGYE